tara:strand:+ start:698 stop:1108 length:411 start_codon:yes stop_codon:yes gene_type:complete
MTQSPEITNSPEATATRESFRNGFSNLFRGMYLTSAGIAPCLLIEVLKCVPGEFSQFGNAEIRNGIYSAIEGVAILSVASVAGSYISRALGSFKDGIFNIVDREIEQNLTTFDTLEDNNLKWYDRVDQKPFLSQNQ